MTLIEVVISLALLGILTAAAVPSIANLRDRYVVTAAAGEIASAHNRARIQAVLQSRVVDLEIRPDSIFIRTGSGSGTSVLWSAVGPARDGVLLASSARTLSFAPTGVTLGFANASFVLTRGSARRQVIISRLGRVRIIP
jgi:Tfp pilus assembly protein FimT